MVNAMTTQHREAQRKKKRILAKKALNRLKYGKEKKEKEKEW